VNLAKIRAWTWGAPFTSGLVHRFTDYIGQRSIISIPYIAYNLGAIIGSVIIACSAVVIGLYIMFIIVRPRLKHGWTVKIGIALVLGAAVCLMHYCAMAGEIIIHI
jgi:NO-binding membrane sensor protein with MHYT domain